MGLFIYLLLVKATARMHMGNPVSEEMPVLKGVG